MDHILSNDRRLGFLIKPLDLFLEQDVQADSQTKLMIAEEWRQNKLFYVAQLLASSLTLDFINVHIALRAKGFAPGQLCALYHLLPQITGETSTEYWAHYKELKPSIYIILGAHAALWANMENGTILDEDNKIKPPCRVFSVHFEELDLHEEGIDIALAEALFEDSDFHLDLSDLIRAHTARLKRNEESLSS